MDDLINNASEIELKIGYTFHDKRTLALAFVHRSYVNENKAVKEHNERLEFLGDSVLGLLISAYLYRYLPTTPEGELSCLRARLIDAGACFQYMQRLDVECHLLLGRGEQRNNGRGRESILADLFEAIIGAVYLDGGFEEAHRFLFKMFSRDIDQLLKSPIQNWKAVLQDHTQKQFQQTPVYQVLNESGPDHSKTFEISVEINENFIGSGKGPSKKEAQQAAAKNALDRYGLLKKQG